MNKYENTLIFAYYGWYTYDIHENYPIFKPPHPPVQTSSTHFTLDVQFQATYLLQTITNQLKESIIQGGWLLYVIMSIF